MGGNALDVLEYYKNKMLKHIHDEQVLLHCLSKLDVVKVNISLLQDTMIGKTVGLVKKRYGENKVGFKAKELVAKWKEIVRQEEEIAAAAQENEAEQSPEQQSEEHTSESAEHTPRSADRSANNTPKSADSSSPPPLAMPEYIPTPIAPTYTPTPLHQLQNNSYRSSSQESEEREVSHEESRHKSHRESKESSSQRESKESSHRESKESSHRESKESSHRESKESSHRESKESSHRKSHKHKKSSRDEERGHDRKHHHSSHHREKHSESRRSGREDGHSHSEFSEPRVKQEPRDLAEDGGEDLGEVRVSREAEARVKKERPDVNIKTEPTFEEGWGEARVKQEVSESSSTDTRDHHREDREHHREDREHRTKDKEHHREKHHKSSKSHKDKDKKKDKEERREREEHEKSKKEKRDKEKKSSREKKEEDSISEERRHKEKREENSLSHSHEERHRVKREEDSNSHERRHKEKREKRDEDVSGEERRQKEMEERRQKETEERRQKESRKHKSSSSRHAELNSSQEYCDDGPQSPDGDISQQNECDTLSSGDQFLRKERESGDRHRSDKHSGDKHSGDKHRSDKHKSDRSDKHKSEKHRDKHSGSSSSSSSSSKKHKSDKESSEGKKKRVRELDMFAVAQQSDHEEEQQPRKKARREENSGGDSARASMPAPLLSAPKFPPLPGSSSIVLPEISPIYKPLPRPPMNSRHHQSEEEALGVLMGQKKSRSAVYSGKKRQRFYDEVPSLFNQCIMVLQDNVDTIQDWGGQYIPFYILEPVLERANPNTLAYIENQNPELMTGDSNTSKLWQKHCERDFRGKKREEMESWKEMYERCTIERAEKLDRLKGKVKSKTETEKSSVRQTKLAYPDVVAKPPRDVARKQVKHGTGLPTGTVNKVGSVVRPKVSDPTAGQSNRPAAVKKPKAPPMMQKAKAMMKGMSRFGRR